MESLKAQEVYDFLLENYNSEQFEWYSLLGLSVKDYYCTKTNFKVRVEEVFNLFTFSLRDKIIITYKDDLCWKITEKECRLAKLLDQMFDDERMEIKLAHLKHLKDMIEQR